MTPTKPKFELKLGMATREAFGKALVVAGRENKDIVVGDADLSKSTYTSLFHNEFPDRFFSCGIAEANMVAIAGGSRYGAAPELMFFECRSTKLQQLAVARIPQLVGSFAAIWDDVLPPVPEEIWRENLAAVARAMSA